MSTTVMNTVEMNTSVETFSAAMFSSLAALCKQNGIVLSLDSDYDVNNMPAKIVEALFTVYDMMVAGKFTYKESFRKLDGSYTKSMKFRIRNIQIHDCCEITWLWLRAKNSFNFNAELEVSTARRLLTEQVVIATTCTVTKRCFIAKESGCDICNVVASNNPDTDE